MDGGAFERVCRFCDDPHDVRHCGRALALYRPPCPERTTRLKMEMERFEVYVDIPARCGRWCSMKTISAATKFRCTTQPLAPSTPRTAALPLVSDLQTPFSLQNSRSKSSVPVSDYAQADPSSGKSKSGKKHTPSRRMERVRRGMAKLSIRPGHERANGGLSASPSAAVVEVSATSPTRTFPFPGKTRNSGEPSAVRFSRQSSSEPSTSP